jgi:ABC-type uncharacterized transport system ATPase subunit
VGSGRDAVVTERLGKRFGEKVALDGFDLTVAEGSVFGLLGPNGAGKTTAVRVLATLLRADAGRAEVAGFDVAREPAEVRRRIGLLTMISNTFVAPSLMPAWLGTLAEWNPLSATVSATRELFGNSVPELVGTSWPAQNALLLAVAWPVLIVAVFLPLAVRRYHATGR